MRLLTLTLALLLAAVAWRRRAQPDPITQRLREAGL